MTCEELRQVMVDDENWRITAHIKPVDPRDTYDYDRARIPFADNIPNVLDSVSAVRARQNQIKILPRDSILVFFDDGDGALAVDLAQQLVALNPELEAAGYGFNLDNIRILEGGLDRWLELGYPTSNAEA